MSQADSLFFSSLNKQTAADSQVILVLLFLFIPSFKCDVLVCCAIASFLTLFLSNLRRPSKLVFSISLFPVCRTTRGMSNGLALSPRTSQRVRIAACIHLEDCFCSLKPGNTLGGIQWMNEMNGNSNGGWFIPCFFQRRISISCLSCNIIRRIKGLDQIKEGRNVWKVKWQGRRDGIDAKRVASLKIPKTTQRDLHEVTQPRSMRPPPRVLMAGSSSRLQPWAEAIPTNPIALNFLADSVLLAVFPFKTHMIQLIRCPHMHGPWFSGRFCFHLHVCSSSVELYKWLRS